MRGAMLNLFYEEQPPEDRWLPLDRYPRAAVRRLVRGKPRIMGQQRVFLNLTKGLTAIGVRYRINDYRYAAKHPHEAVCIIGKPHVLDKVKWENPIVFGAAVYSHPTDDPELFNRLNIKGVLVPGEWMRQMCEPYWGDKVAAWPVGIDTDRWEPKVSIKPYDILVYDKVRWEHDEYEQSLIVPILSFLHRGGLKVAYIRYGYYSETMYEKLLAQSKSMLFLCEHETQGIAYLQALSCNVPILAWDRGGYWQDPAYYPRIKFQPVSSVPYWNEQCGVRFRSLQDLQYSKADMFISSLNLGKYHPRDYVLENLTLEKCAARYVELVNRFTSL